MSTSSSFSCDQQEQQQKDQAYIESYAKHGLELNLREGKINFIVNRIFVTRFDRETTEDELKQIFTTFGDIRSVNLITSTKRPYGFITFKESEDCKALLKVKHQLKLKLRNQKLFVNEARFLPKKQEFVSPPRRRASRKFFKQENFQQFHHQNDNENDNFSPQESLRYGCAGGSGYEQHPFCCFHSLRFALPQATYFQPADPTTVPTTVPLWQGEPPLAPDYPGLVPVNGIHYVGDVSFGLQPLNPAYIIQNQLQNSFAV